MTTVGREKDRINAFGIFDASRSKQAKKRKKKQAKIRRKKQLLHVGRRAKKAKKKGVRGDAVD